MMEIEEKYSAGIYSKRPIIIVKGKGSRVWDIEGREYIDCVGGFGVAIVGHSNEKVVETICEQAKQIIVCPTVFYNDKRAELLRLVAEITPKELSKTFLSNSGTEAVECALKIARKYTGKKEFIAMKRAFHGRTMGSLSATWKKKYKKNFEPLVPGFKHATFNNLDSVQDLITNNTAAIIVEPVQGEGGVYVADYDFIKGLRDIADDKDILLIFDEIQTGFGRTGKMFALEHYNVTPDILCIGKGMAGGLPIGATVAKPEIFESLDKGEHGSTFGGNPVVAAAAIAAIKYIINNKLPEHAKIKGEYLLDKLRRIESNVIREVRGIGLMIGIELRFPVKKYILEALKKGVLIHSSGISTLRMLPPLIITYKEIDMVIEVLEEVLKT
ncbi:MAG: acetylornithine/succinylornithine family transaminase [Thermoproteales archaeon]|nr:acetylornithine/succinylornithine family transaminase [Thermoproteales archaeon]